MKKQRTLAILTLTAMAVMSVSAASAASVNDAKLVSQTKAVSTHQQSSSTMQSNAITPNTEYVFTAAWEKSYKNLYNMTVATQTTYTQWNGNYSYNTSKGALWQDNWTAVAYSYDTEKNSWNYFYSNVGQANQSVHFTSGIPTPWGSVGGSSLTSTIVTTVYPDGSSE